MSTLGSGLSTPFYIQLSLVREAFFFVSAVRPRLSENCFSFFHQSCLRRRQQRKGLKAMSGIGSGQRKTPLNSFPASSPDFLPSACLYVSPQSLKEGRTCFQSGVEIMCLTRGKSAPFFSSFISVTWAGRTWPHTNLNTSHPHGGSSHPKTQCLSWSSLPLLCHHENKTQILLFGRLESLMVILKHVVLINTPKQLKALESLFKTTKAFPDEMPLVYWSLTRDMSFSGMRTSFLHEHRPLISSERHMSPGVKEEGSPE